MFLRCKTPTSQPNKCIKARKQLFIQTCLLLFLLACLPLKAAVVEQGPNPQAPRTNELTVLLKKEETIEFTIEQNEGEFTLLTFLANGLDFHVELINALSQPAPTYYNDYFFGPYFNVNFLITSEDCLKCTFRIDPSINKAEVVPLTITQDTFSQKLHKDRLAIEQSADAFMRDYYNFSLERQKKLQAAVINLQQFNDTNSQIRGCIYKYLLLNTIQIGLSEKQETNTGSRGKHLDQLLKCSGIAPKTYSNHFDKLIETQVFFYVSSERCKNNSCTNAITKIIYQIESSNIDSRYTSYALGFAYRALAYIKNHDKSSIKEITEAGLTAIKLFEEANATINSGITHKYVAMQLFRNQFVEDSLQHLKSAIYIEEKLKNRNFQFPHAKYELASFLLLIGNLHDSAKVLDAIEAATKPEILNNHFWATGLNLLKIEMSIKRGLFDSASHLLENTLLKYQVFLDARTLIAIKEQQAIIKTEQGKTKEAAKIYADLATKVENSGVTHAQQGSTLFNIYSLILSLQSEAALTLISKLEGEFSYTNTQYGDYELVKLKINALNQLKDHQQAHNILLKEYQSYKSPPIHRKIEMLTYLAEFAYKANLDSSLVNDYTSQALELIEKQRYQQIDISYRQDVLAAQQRLFEITIQSNLDNKLSKEGALISSLFLAESFNARTLYETLIGENDLLQSKKLTGDLNTITRQILDNKSALIDGEGIISLRKLNQQDLINYQNQLGKQDGVLYFFIGEETSYSWLITHDNILSEALPNHDTLENQVANLLEQLTNHPGKQIVNWEQLKDLQELLSDSLLSLYGDKLKTIDHLTIVPDGSLHRLPFNLLVNPATQKPLIDTAEIHYAPSIATSHWLNQLPAKSINDTKLLVVANPTPVKETLAQTSRPEPFLQRFGGRVGIPGADKEAKALINLWKEFGESQLLRADKATKKALLQQQLGNFDILHFATHAEVDWNNPQLSAIQLAPDTSLDPLFESPHLSVGEISQLDLNAELVVLSACDTNSGKLVTGEGPIGLSRAFIEAGAKRVLSTLWPVDDQATALLQEKFYQGLLKNKLNPAEALRQAQLFIRSQPEYQHPYFWAGFMFIGKEDLWVQ